MANYYYEVDVYKIYRLRAECISIRYFKTSSPFKGDDTICKRLNSECEIMKCISKLNV